MTEQRHIEIGKLFKQLKEDFPKEMGAFLKLSQSLESGGGHRAQKQGSYSGSTGSGDAL